MNSRTTHTFRTLLSELPEQVQVQARQAYELFRVNPAHPGLRFKKVYSNPLIYSARVGIAHRALGVLTGDTVVWYWIGSHADYDSLLEQL